MSSKGRIWPAPANSVHFFSGYLVKVRQNDLEQLVTALLNGLNRPQSQPTPRATLAAAAALLTEHLHAAASVSYELIPETGGVPQAAPIFSGDWLDPDQSQAALAANLRRGVLSGLIGRWEPYYEADAPGWCARCGLTDADGFACFLAIEAVQAFIFLPIQAQQTRLAAVLLTFREARPFPDATRKILDACGALIGAHLALPGLAPVPIPRKQKAIAHTLYGKVAVMFKGQLDALEIEMTQALGEQLPPGIREHLQTARQTVFEGMRSLVIEASGDLLVDLESMSLAKALQTAVAALKRAWPPGQRIIIDLYPIPLVIERQSLALRQILYTLALEAVGNAIKHGGPAPYINIDLNWADDQVLAQVIDHGQGFDRDAQPFSEYGLGFWQSYIVQRLGGTFAVSSQPGFGTVVTAVIPIIPARIEYYAE